MQTDAEGVPGDDGPTPFRLRPTWATSGDITDHAASGQRAVIHARYGILRRPLFLGLLSISATPVGGWLGGTAEPIPCRCAPAVPHPLFLDEAFHGRAISCRNRLRARLGRREEWRVGRSRRSQGQGGRSRSSPLLRAQLYYARSPAPQQCDDGQLARQMLQCCSSQPLACSPLNTTVSRKARNGSLPRAPVLLHLLRQRVPSLRVAVLGLGEGPSATTSVVPHTRRPRRMCTILKAVMLGSHRSRSSLIPSDDEFDLDSRSDTSFESLDELLSGARDKVQPSRVSDTGMCLDLTLLGRPTC